MTVAQSLNAGLRRIPAWPIYIVCAGWASWLFWQGATGGLGPEPVSALERRYGELALWLLVASLVVSPLRRLTGVSLLRFRRALGVSAFGLAVAHLAVWAVLDVQSLSRVVEEVLRRPYVTLGMAGFALLVPLAVTSNDSSVRRMGAAAWQRLHRLAYPAAILVALHYLWIAKIWDGEAILWSAAILGLLILRLRRRTGRQAA